MTPVVYTALARQAWSEEASRPESDGGAADSADSLLRYLERGAEVPREVRLLAARGLLVEDAATQLVLIVRSLRDPDPEVAGTAAGTLASLPADLAASVLAEQEGLAEFSDAWLRARQEAGSAVDAVMDQQIAARRPAEASPSPASDAQEALDESGDPSVEGDAGADPADEAGDAARKPLSMLTVPERIKRAMAGSREERSVLVRDPNDTVARAVLSSPKLTENEVESFARMTNVSDEVLRLISRNRTWTRNYSVTACLVRNPKTPPPVSLTLLPRLNQHDIKRLSTDRNVPEPVRLAARKLVLQREGRKG